MCASRKITFTEGKVFRCPDCNFIYYHNIAAATGCLIIVPETGAEKPDKTSDRLVFLVRGKEPAIGKLDLPGGFVDIGEGVIEGLYREMQEELGWKPATVPELLASFSNVYEYKGINYNTCDMYFSVRAPGLKPEDLRLEEGEISGVRFLKPDEIDFDQIAFPSTVNAVKKYLTIF